MVTLTERGDLSRAARSFLRTESGSAALLLTAAAVALTWANVSSSGYEGFWHTELSFTLGAAELTEDLRHWVNDGLMVCSSSASGWRSPAR